MIRTSFRGTHNWPEASQHAGREVKFLEHEHRHTFHILVEFQVTDSDREEEFFVLQSLVDHALGALYEKVGLVHVLGRRSCETIAEELIEHLREVHFYSNSISVEVWEDNEVGARIESSP